MFYGLTHSKTPSVPNCYKSVCLQMFQGAGYGLNGSILSNIHAEHGTHPIVPALKDAGSKRWSGSEGSTSFIGHL